MTGAPSGEAPDDGNRKLPLFYRSLALLDSAKHAKLSLKQSASYRFAREASVIPVMITEFGPAALSYPVVFVRGNDGVSPALLLGARQNANLYVDETGQWADGAYVPAYVRRYPFLLIEDREAGRAGLCIDETSDRIVPGDVRPFFTDGKRSDFVSEALNLCVQFKRDADATQRFVEALETHGLLDDRTAQFRIKDGGTFAVTGFMGVDRDRWLALPDDTWLDFRTKGWIAAVELHLASMLNMTRLLDREARNAA